MEPEANDDHHTLLITGASRRIGAHLAEHFLKAGYRVIGTYRTKRDRIDELEAMGMTALKLDLLDPAQINAFPSQVRKHTDRIDTLIHNASVWHTDEECLANPDKAIAMHKVHAVAPIQLTEKMNQIIPPDTDANGLPNRQILFISDAHLRDGAPDYTHYAASKAAIEGALRSLAVKYAPQVRINVIAPGLMMFHPHDDDEIRRERLRCRLFPIEPGADEMRRTVEYLINCRTINQAIIRLDTGRWSCIGI